MGKGLGAAIGVERSGREPRTLHRGSGLEGEQAVEHGAVCHGEAGEVAEPALLAARRERAFAAARVEQAAVREALPAESLHGAKNKTREKNVL